MAAIVKQYQRTELPNVLNPTPIRASQSAMGELGKGLNDVGTMFNDWQDAVDTADAKRADAQFSDFIRKSLYEDGSGYMYQQGGSAMAGRQSAFDAIQAEYDRLLMDMPQGVRSRVQGALDARRQSAFTDIDKHAFGQRTTYMTDAINARVTSDINDAISNPSEFATSIKRADDQIMQMAELNGWAPEVTEQRRRETRSTAHTGIITRLESVNPVDALAYLRENREEIEAKDYVRLESALIPAARERRGSDAGRSAFQGTVDDLASLPVGFKWSDHIIGGATRADGVSGLDATMQTRLANMISAAEQQGVSITLKSGYRSPELQAQLWNDALKKYGSPEEARKWVAPPGASEHNNGNAGDLAFGSDAAIAWAHDNAAKYGLYFPLANENWHVEVMGTRGTAEYKAPVSSQGLLGAVDARAKLLDIADPTERDAALRAFDLNLAQYEKTVSTQREDATTRAFETISQWEVNGGDPNANPVDKLSLEDRRILGPAGVNTLRAYASAAISGKKPVTNDAVFVEVTDLVAKAQTGGQVGHDAREKLKSINPLDYRMSLNDSDFQTFVAQRASILNPKLTKEDIPKAPAVSTLMSQIGPRLNAAGITNSGSKATPEKYAAIQAEMTRWAYANPDKSSDPVQVDRQASMLLTSVTFNPKGWNNERDLSIYKMDFGGMTRSPDDDVTTDTIKDAVANDGLSINGVKVSQENSDDVYHQLVAALNGIDPATEFDERASGMIQPTAEQYIKALSLYMQ